MAKLRTLDLFSGIGGFTLGLDSTGYFETVAFCEIEAFPCKVLNKHWPEVPIYNDVKELSYEKLQADGIISRRRGIDVICGGYPCQPFSVAGRQGGEDDPRHLWPEYFRLVRELRPHYAIGENVGGHLRLGLDTVLEDLDSENYTVRCFSVEAASLGAPHRRERIFWIADNMGDTECDGSSASKIGRSNLETPGRTTKGEDKALESEGTSGSGNNETVPDTDSKRRGGRDLSGRGAEQRELLKTEQEGRALGREAERCSELLGTEGEDSAPDVADTEHERHKKRVQSKAIGNRGRQVSTTNDVADTESGDAQDGLSEQGISSEAESSRETVGSSRRDSHEQEEQRGETTFESYLGGGNDGISAWLDGSWERGIPRVAPSNKLRVPRLKALGNAVLPQLVYMVGMTIVVSASCDSLSTKSSENEEESGG